MRLIESKAIPVLPSAIASPNLRREGASGTVGVGVRYSDPSKKCRVRASSGWEREYGSCSGIGVASVQGRKRKERKGKAGDTVDGGRVAEGS